MSGAYSKKGIAFIIDAVLASLLVVMAIVVAQHHLSTTSRATVNRNSNTEFISSDLMTALAELKIGELNNSYIKSLINNSNITNVNGSVIEQIGQFWAEDKGALAMNLTKIMLDGLMDNKTGIGVFMNGEAVYEINNSDGEIIRSSKKIISGIQSNRSRYGYNARAFALKSKKNNTLIMMGDVILSSVKKTSGGTNGNGVNVTYNLTVPANCSISDAQWFIESAWTDNKFKAYINGDFIPGSSASGSKLLTDLQSYLNEGPNDATVEFRFGSGGNEGGDDGASHFTVDYETNVLSTLADMNTKYFAKVESNCSIRYKRPVFVMGELSSVEVNMSLYGINATLAYTIDGITYNVSKKNISAGKASWSSTEISNSLAGYGLSFANMSHKYVWFVVDVDDYHERENFGTGRIIYPNSKITIKTSFSTLIYGYIDVTKIIPVDSYSSVDWGDFYRRTTWIFNASNATFPLMLDSQLAWLYDSGTNPDQDAILNGKEVYSHPPQPLVVEFARYGYATDSGEFVNGRNNYTLQFSDGYSINPFNSLVSFLALIRSTVGYGETFETQSEATSDALRRLNETIAGFIDLIEIGNEVTTVGNVPSLWGPTIAEVRTWE
ncbi:hypothetical protein JXA85_04055 [Candidatus Woesearchaeota archaeon]|nr:hypothetical protein [Candidatus Woesearchaeota archaeon]